MKKQWIITLLLFTTLLVIVPHVLQYIETRQGFSLYDPLLAAFIPADVSAATFFFIYISAITAILILIQNPQYFLNGLQAYGLLVAMRMLCLLALPLNPPENMIILDDPFIDNLFGGGKPLTKDLFFSGHVSAAFLIYLLMKGKKVRWIFLGLFVVIAILVLLQHVHYTIDVIAAPLFSWIAYRITCR